MMNAATEFDLGPLTWVKGEIDLALQKTEDALAQYESSGDQTQLKFCRTHVHQVHGALSIVGLDGVTRVTEALESLMLAIEEGRVVGGVEQKAAIAQALDAIRKYLDDLLSGAANQPLRLLASYQGLAKAQGLVAHASELFFPDLGVRPSRRAQESHSPLNHAQYLEALKGARLRYQKGLLLWLKQAHESGRQQMRDAVAEIEDLQKNATERTFWWVALGFLEAFAEPVLAADLWARQLCARVDMQIRKLQEGGKIIPERLLCEMLYCIAQVPPSTHPQVAEIQAAYSLKSMLPQAAVAAMSAPQEAVLRRLRDTLSAAEEAWNKFCNGSASSLGGFVEQARSCAKLSADLGHTDIKRLGQGFGAIANWLAEDGKRFSDGVAMEVATAILLLENAQENYLHLGNDFAQQVDLMIARLQGQIAGKPVVSDRVPLLDEMTRRAQERLLIGQVSKEIQKNLGQVEQILDTFFRDPGAAHDLAQLDAQLRQIAGALAMLGHFSAVNHLKACGEQIKQFAQSGYQASKQEFEAVANQLSLLGFFVDSLINGESDFDAFVKQIENRGKEHSQQEASEFAEPASVELDLAPQVPSDLLGHSSQDVPQGSSDATPEAQEKATDVLEEVVVDIALPELGTLDEVVAPTSAAAPQVVIPARAEPEPEIDEELLAIFLEEAREVLATIGEHKGVLASNPYNTEALTTIRRSTHTLKGSGRMVGLTELGEAAWELEQTYNQWLRQDQTADADLLSLAEQEYGVFLAWVDYLESGNGVKPDPTAMVNLARKMRGLEPLPVPVMVVDASPSSDEAALQPPLPHSGVSVANEVEAQEAGPDVPDNSLQAIPDEFGNQSEGFNLSFGDTQAEPGAASVEFALEPAGEALACSDSAWIPDSKGDSESQEVIPSPVVTLAADEGVSEPITVTLAESSLSGEEVQQISLSEVSGDAAIFGVSEFESFELSTEPLNAETVEIDFGTASEDSLKVSTSAISSMHVDESCDLDAEIAIEPPVELPEVPSLDGEEVIELEAADSSFELIEDSLASPSQQTQPEEDRFSAESLSREEENVVEEMVLSAEPPDASISLGSADAVNDLGQFADAPPISEPVAPSITLYDIFREEAKGYLKTLMDCDVLLGENPAAPTTFEMTRAAHTMGGISATVGLMPLSRVAVALEHALLRRLASSNPDSLEGLVAIHQAIITLQQMFETLSQQRTPEEQPQLVAALEDVFQHASIQESLEEELPAAAELPVEDQIALQSVGAIDTSVAELKSVQDAVEQVPKLTLTDEFDDQLLPIFLEEAADLLRDLTSQLRTWRAEPDNKTVAHGIGRILHTFKGSARMAGAMNLGELTHLLETRVEEAMRAGAANAAFVDEIENGCDILVQSVDRLRDGDFAPVVPILPNAQVLATDGEQPLVGAVVKPAVQTASIAGAVESEADHEATSQRAMLRVRADLIDRLVNEAGELSIARARIEGEMRGLKNSLLFLTENVIRLRNQLREIEIQAESQIQARVAQSSAPDVDFDPLELDRFTRFQELTRFMAESVNDVATVQQNLLKGLDDANAAILAQSRINRSLQQELMSVRMVPFSSQTERLYRIVRQTAKDVGKRATLDIVGGQVDIDRSVLDKMMAPIEHMLRNAITHGIEPREDRLAAGKAEVGEITVKLAQEGNEFILSMSDDGRGLLPDKIRARAEAMGLLQPGIDVDENTLFAFIFHPGFSTASELTQVSGRGIGMDVVKTEVSALGGRIEILSQPNQGTTFRLYLPLTLAVTQTLLVRAGLHNYALPSTMIEQVLEIKEEELTLVRERTHVEWKGNTYPFFFLPHLLGDVSAAPEAHRQYWVLLLRSGSQRVAVLVDELKGNHEVVVKNIGAQLARVVGIAGATVLGDGSVVLILNPVALASRVQAVNLDSLAPVPVVPKEVEEVHQPTVMVVDDSLTVRKITSRLLTREGYVVVLAKDGADALEQLIDARPDVILSDIEMPRMDGFDFVRNLRADDRLREIPVIMITSRTADKHRNYALEIGANHYLGKPYDEDELLGLIGGYCNKLH